MEEDDGSGLNDAYQHHRPAFTLTAGYRDPNSRLRVDISRGLQRRRDLEHFQSEADKSERRFAIEAAESETSASASAARNRSGEDEDEDDDATWERQQIQKAVSSKVNNSA